jgi:hypothetical protein
MTPAALLVGSPTTGRPSLVSMHLAKMLKAKKRYRQHRYNASKRKPSVPFLLSFVSWLTIWHESGHWHERGVRRGQFCMARHRDAGNYVEGNVTIITNGDNVRVAFGGKPHTQEWLAKMRKACKRRANTSWLANVRAFTSSPSYRRKQRHITSRRTRMADGRFTNAPAREASP